MEIDFTRVAVFIVAFSILGFVLSFLIRKKQLTGHIFSYELPTRISDAIIKLGKTSDDTVEYGFGLDFEKNRGFDTVTIMKGKSSSTHFPEDTEIIGHVHTESNPESAKVYEQQRKEAAIKGKIYPPTSVYEKNMYIINQVPSHNDLRNVIINRRMFDRFKAKKGDKDSIIRYISSSILLKLPVDPYKNYNEEYHLLVSTSGVLVQYRVINDEKIRKLINTAYRKNHITHLSSFDSRLKAVEKELGERTDEVIINSMTNKKVDSKLYSKYYFNYLNSIGIELRAVPKNEKGKYVIKVKKVV